MSEFRQHWEAQVRACAKGHKQLAFVNELLNGDSYFRMEPVPGRPWMGPVPMFGECRLEYGSYKNLKKRLEQAGFELVKEDSKVLGSGNIRLL